MNVRNHLYMPVKKVVLYQELLCGKVADSDINLIKGMAPDFFVLPEYFFINGAKDFTSAASSAKENKEYLCSLSKELQCTIVGGTMIEFQPDGLYNVCYVAKDGIIKGRYAKCNPTPDERREGVLPGDEMRVYSISGVSLSVLICSDVLESHNFHTMGEMLSDMVFVPSISPYREETEEEKFSRDEQIFVEGAMNSRSYVVKVCGIGKIFEKRLQGRSLVAAPWGILTRVPPDEEHTKQILNVELDMEKIWAYQRFYTLR